jgi:hypothetical protein
MCRVQLSVTDCLNGRLVMELATCAFPKVFHFAHFIILGTKAYFAV